MTLGTIEVYGSAYCLFVFHSQRLLYCDHCFNCSDCFGCVGLRNKQYCVFNKQYTKEEYEALVPKIIEHMHKDAPSPPLGHELEAEWQTSGSWGEFFPLQTTPLPYNVSIAQRYFPLTREQAIAAGLQWHDKEMEDVAGAIDAAQLPDGLPDTDDPIVVRSALSGRPFRITSQEIRWYRRHGVPLPRSTYDERLEERAAKLGGVRLFDHTCAKTGKPIRTVYPADWPYVIWDREEYEREFGA